MNPSLSPSPARSGGGLGGGSEEAGERCLALSALPGFAKTGESPRGFGMQGPACSGNRGGDKTKRIKKLSIQEVGPNN